MHQAGHGSIGCFTICPELNVSCLQVSRRRPNFRQARVRDATTSRQSVTAGLSAGGTGTSLLLQAVRAR